MRIRSRLPLIAVTWLAMAVSSCSAFFEEDISDRQVVLLAPSDGLKTSSMSPVFWWEYMDGADFYNLQIVSPEFAFTERLVLDTIITGNKLQYRLYPGNFEWRVSANNSAFSTPFTTFSLIVDTVATVSTAKDKIPAAMK